MKRCAHLGQAEEVIHLAHLGIDEGSQQPESLAGVERARHSRKSEGAKVCAELNSLQAGANWDDPTGERHLIFGW